MNSLETKREQFNEPEQIEFLIEGSYENALVTFIRNGKAHPVKHSLADLPIP